VVVYHEIIRDPTNMAQESKLGKSGIHSFHVDYVLF
jgi:hypothetical protein